MIDTDDCQKLLRKKRFGRTFTNLVSVTYPLCEDSGSLLGPMSVMD